jgi:hypothetical protein
MHCVALTVTITAETARRPLNILINIDANRANDRHASRAARGEAGNRDCKRYRFAVGSIGP